ncbi:MULTISPECIES: hypothetical protein [unclassified Rhodococcus (in: high G+C Gram-positive bacteria)]|uniref:hypothetical protein n=1 Tax=unclassified Rhodococcus (in: high G+C Gram-positive bacteria) TaxID=192944 RepID=UPI000929FBC8|nr:hypothetical protein [Rhodococcus sp. M8]OLL19830.1 hypothetical protein BKE56_007445 [Rhodococcus sp. M8]QPG43670.1 hypothetical protein ISO16_17050 [Rhodococcus sp. M8]
MTSRVAGPRGPSGSGLRARSVGALRGFLAEGTERAYAKDYRLLFGLLYRHEKYWDETDYEEIYDDELSRRRSVDNSRRIGGSTWAR